MNFSRMKGSRGIGDYAQHSLQADEAREDNCSYSDDAYGPVDVAHDVRYLPDAQRIIPPIGQERKPLGLGTAQRGAYKVPGCARGRIRRRPGPWKPRPEIERRRGHRAVARAAAKRLQILPDVFLVSSRHP